MTLEWDLLHSDNMMDIYCLEDSTLTSSQRVISCCEGLVENQYRLYIQHKHQIEVQLFHGAEGHRIYKRKFLNGLFNLPTLFKELNGLVLVNSL